MFMGNGKGRTLLQDLDYMRKQMVEMKEESRNKIADMEIQLNSRILRAGDGQLTKATTATRCRYLHNFGSKILRRTPRSSVIGRDSSRGEHWTGYRCVPGLESKSIRYEC